MKKITITLLFFCLFISIKVQAQSIINVPADHATIQLAVNNAAANDVIIVADGTYNESVNLATGPAGILIKAENTGGSTVNGGAVSSFLASGHTGNITIDGFVLTSTLNDANQGVIHITNLSGKLTVNNNTITAGNTHGIRLFNTTTETNTSILNNTFGTFGNDDFIRIEAGENGVGTNSNIIIDGNTNTGTIEDDAIEINFESNNSNSTLVITNNNFSNWTNSGNGLDIHFGNGSPAASNQEIHYTIENNTLTNPDGPAITIDLDGINNTFFGTIVNNTIIGDNVNTTRGINIDGDSTSNGTNSTMVIDNNNISGIIGTGINIRPFSDDTTTETWNFVINNNTIDNPNSDNTPGLVEAGILIDDSSGVDDENYIINAEIINNNITNLNANTDCIKIARPTTTTAGTAVINYEVSGNSCAPTLIGSPTASVDPVPNTLDLLEVGNLVWFDSDVNGLNDGGESGVEGVIINFSGNGFTGSTSTNSNGIYKLPALTPGTYTLTAVPNSTYPDVTLKNVGVNTTIDSDFDQTTKTVIVTLVAGGADNIEIDLGVYDQVLSTTDVEFNHSISIYPNPVINQFTIKSELTDYSYSIYSILGQEISSKRSTNNIQHVDFSNFSKGVYLLVIRSKEKNYTYKLVKK